MPKVYMDEVPVVQTIGENGIGAVPPVPVEKVEKIDGNVRGAEKLTEPASHIPNPRGAEDGKVITAKDDAWQFGDGGVSPGPEPPEETQPIVGLGEVGYAVLGSQSGSSLPAGGTEGQVLAKKSSADYDVGWVDNSGGLPEYSLSDGGKVLGLDVEYSEQTAYVVEEQTVFVSDGSCLLEEGTYDASLLAEGDIVTLTVDGVPSECEVYSTGGSLAFDASGSDCGVEICFLEDIEGLGALFWADTDGDYAISVTKTIAVPSSIEPAWVNSGVPSYTASDIGKTLSVVSSEESSSPVVVQGQELTTDAHGEANLASRSYDESLINVGDVVLFNVNGYSYECIVFEDNGYKIIRANNAAGIVTFSASPHFAGNPHETYRIMITKKYSEPTIGWAPGLPNYSYLDYRKAVVLDYSGSTETISIVKEQTVAHGDYLEAGGCVFNGLSAGDEVVFTVDGVPYSGSVAPDEYNPLVISTEDYTYSINIPQSGPPMFATVESGDHVISVIKEVRSLTPVWSPSVPLVVHVRDALSSFNMDKTWKEINDSYQRGAGAVFIYTNPVTPSEVQGYYLWYMDSEYISLVWFNREIGSPTIEIDSLTFSVSGPDDYPSTEPSAG